ncbi:uncharacterized protein LOC123440967 [Hordeum vulgare subsp. vulgare]|uniref:RING-CH-type domain-containing protein n=1 Tax=Hordeum vulgare subsp. vulgare TaxID=112509 RepID=A0A8I6WGW5_HORVV|nr:uncharacterized protein LOC123440967 [Hordeum vulgare subsp. vulgare]
MERGEERRPRSQQRVAITAIELGARNDEPMQQQDGLSSSSSSSSSSYSMMQCRICHEEEDESSAAMESPCACSGSLKYAHRGCVQRWCDEKGSTLCEICLQGFEPGYTVPPKKAPVVETLVTVSEDEDDDEEEEELHGQLGMHYAASDTPMDGPDPAACSWCRPLAITFTIILLVWHLIAVVTIEAAEHCAFSLLTMYLLRATGILLPLYAVMRVVRMIQHGRRQYQLQQLLEEQRRRNASRRSQEEQQQLVISIR